MTPKYITATPKTIDEILGNEKIVDVHYKLPKELLETEPKVVCGKCINLKKIKSPQDILDNLETVIDNLPKGMFTNKKVKIVKVYMFKEVEKYNKEFGKDSLTLEESAQFSQNYGEIMYYKLGVIIDTKPQTKMQQKREKVEEQTQIGKEWVKQAKERIKKAKAEDGRKYL